MCGLLCKSQDLTSIIKWSLGGRVEHTHWVREQMVAVSEELLSGSGDSL